MLPAILWSGNCKMTMCTDLLLVAPGPPMLLCLRCGLLLLGWYCLGRQKPNNIKTLILPHMYTSSSLDSPAPLQVFILTKLLLLMYYKCFGSPLISNDLLNKWVCWCEVLFLCSLCKLCFFIAFLPYLLNLANSVKCHGVEPSCLMIKWSDLQPAPAWEH